jgi:4-carboxymuconolactone decarboxylase
MVAVALLAALARDIDFKRHIEAALHLGITRGEIIEIMTHVAHYAEWPAGHNGQRIAQEVFACRPGAADR